ncbi:acyltransferase family protein [Protaetiibacter mangrovi]|uniref:Acyltransferase n=1 Tax=Protaetiibacter mangrovi TaxID=2970926 RepID=A0ABT1ZBT1_9MICO|nr:acyltransferase family protein [Protaetiibacter mangrovi]MCS0498161.1 acyltransferase [Protaetiibacter mangrovi]
MTAAVASAERAVDPGTEFRSPYRPELEGLRAVAILLVAASHLWWGRISGGIDVFLVVSGYLITVTLVLRWVRSGRVGALRYLRSLAGRLLPAAVLVLGTVAATTAFVLAVTRPSLASDILRSTRWAALFGENWYLAFATDGYLSDDRVLNPVEHFWALSMQVQFYAIWLLLVAGMALVLRRGSTPRRRLRLATSAIAVVTVASWVWSVVETLHVQPVAYLDTSARIWEFGAGALLALLGARLRPGRAWGAVLGWLGLAMVVGLGFLGDFDPWFPGIASVWPVLGTALVLIGANSASPIGAHRLLGSRPAVWLGGLAFGLYLWHWPMLSALAIMQNRRTFSLVDGLTIVLAALILAWMMRQVLEQPWQRWGRATPWAAIVAAVLVLALGAASLVQSERLAAAAPVVVPAPEQSAAPVGAGDPTSTAEPDDADPPGVFPDAASLAAAVSASARWTHVPDALITAADAATTAYGDESCVHRESWSTLCVAGDADGTRTAVVVGDSVAASWLPALTGALGPDWRIVLATRGACPTAAVASYYVGATDPAWVARCAEIRGDFVAGILESSPDLVILTTSSRTLDRLVSGATGASAREEWRTGMAATLDALAPVSSKVVVVAPPPLGAPACGSADFETGGSRCRAAITEEWWVQSAAERAAAGAAGVGYVDTGPWFCTDAGVCPWAADGSVIRVDTHHLTASFSQRLAAVMRAALLDAVPGLRDVGVGAADGADADSAGVSSPVQLGE